MAGEHCAVSSKQALIRESEKERFREKKLHVFNEQLLHNKLLLAILKEALGGLTGHFEFLSKLLIGLLIILQNLRFKWF